MVEDARGGLARAHLPSRETARPARIAVMPAYNEAPTIEGVLDDLYPRIDRLIVVDDGSRDATPEIVMPFRLDVQSKILRHDRLGVESLL